MNGDEILFQSELTRVVRQLLPDGRRVIIKEMLGGNALSRSQHERRILERLRGVQGVPHLAQGSFAATALAMEDTVAVPLLPAASGVSGVELVTLAERVAIILAAVHQQGVTHRNINPDNLLLSDGLTPTLIDFSLATTFTEERPAFLHHREIAGSLGYLAPEQTGRTGRGVDQRADLYALGATLYRLAAGVPPFQEKDPLQLVHDVLARVPAVPVRRSEPLPQPLSDIIMKLLEKEPDRRYQSAQGVAHDLALLRERLGSGISTAFPLAEHDFAPRLTAPSRLVGREREVAALEAALEQAISGDGSCLLIRGCPGVGKSTLVNELRPMVTARGGFFCSGKFEQYRRDLSSDAIYQALRALGRLLLAEPEDELDRFRKRLRERLGPNATLVASFLPEYAMLLEVGTETPPDDPAITRQRLIQATIDNVAAIASPERPLVVVLDDLQWGASTPLGFLEAIMTGEAIPGLLVVGSCRDCELEEQHPLALLLERRERLTEPPTLLTLENLPEGELALYLEEVLRLAQGEGVRLARALGRRTGGNPYHTLEMVNALRRDGALSWVEGGWKWDAEAVRRHPGNGDLVGLLAARVELLSSQAQTLIEAMACLGGELEPEPLRIAAGLSPAEYEESAACCFQEGLLVASDGGRVVRFRHDRVQQAAYARLEPDKRLPVHLRLARRLAVRPELELLAAEQYLPASSLLEEPGERKRAITLFRASANRARGVNFREAERFLTAAISLLAGEEEEGERPLLLALQSERHAALYGLGCFEEADGVYLSIEGLCRGPLERSDATSLQVCSLTNRARPQEALELGLAFLEELGIAVPGPDELDAAAERGVQQFRQWVDSEALESGRLRPAVTEPRTLAAARVINKIIPAAFFCGKPKMSWWLVLESRRLWAEQGPCAALVGPLAHLSFVSIWLAGDFRQGHRAVGHVLLVSEQRGWEPETSQARFLYAMTVGPWFDPLPQNVALSLRAEEGLLKGGDLQNACFTYYATISQLLDCAPTLEGCQAEIERTLAFASRTGNAHVEASLLPYRELVKDLRGESGEQEQEGAGGNSTSQGIRHSISALRAALRGDAGELLSQIEAALAYSPLLLGTHLMARVSLLYALALAQKARSTPAGERGALLARLDDELHFLAERAADAPANFAHLVAWIKAERAWGAGELKAALRGFNAALEAAKRAGFPWQRALITERAALFQQECRLGHLSAVLMAEAVELYREWGAQAKVRQLEESHPFLRSRRRNQQGGSAMTVSSDTIDMLAILRASRALSSETSLERLTGVLVEVLENLTGATSVSLLITDEQGGDWQLVTAGGKEALGRLPVAEAAALGLVPLSLFRYVERTREPLMVEDATRDDRFSHDPHLSGYGCCSMLAVPILNHGLPRALLLLENRLSRGAFTADLLDAVTLIAGQLAVSLENALLYQSLEESVRRRTLELARANEALKADIAERRRAEQETRDAYRRISDILEFLPDATFVVDASGTVIAWNRAIEMLTGVSKEEMLGRGDSAYALPFYGEQRKILIDMLDEEPADRERYYPGIKSDGKMLSAEARVMLRDEVHWMWSSATPLYNVRGEKVGGIQALRDMTKLRRSEQERSRLEAQLQHAGMMESVMEQLGHDLKTPLTPLFALLPVIGKQVADPTVGKMIDICQESVNQIHSLSSKSLNLFRLSCRQTPLQPAPVVLSYAVDCCLDNCAGLFLKRGVRCLNKVDPAVTVQAASEQLNLLLDNLLSNAARFAARDGTVTVAAAIDGNTAVVSVADDGIGLKPGQSAQIFEEFFKGDQARNDVGTQGLGLAICKRIIMNHKGRIWAESPGSGLGTTMFFTLKLASPPPSNPKREEQQA